MSSNAVLALLDGPMVDDGTASEIGIFWEGINLFVRGCIEDVGQVVDKFDKAIEILRTWKSEIENKI